MHTTSIPALAGALALLTLGGAASADGLYVKGFAGMSQLSSTDATVGAAPTQTGLGFDPGLLAGGSIGWAYPERNMAVELEWAYRSGDASDLSAAIGTGGDLASTAAMVNAIYSFETVAGAPWRPYVGAGIGVVTEMDIDIDAGPEAGEFSGRGGTALQAIAGVAYQITDQISVLGDVRYFTVGEMTLDRAGGGTATVDYDTFDVSVGFKFAF
ncbi:MAG: outer membrane beta-barrel protein [Pseudomonadota bacterium]